MKACSDCQVEKPEAEFSLLKTGKLYSYCRQCNSARSRKWSEGNRDRRRATNKAWWAKQPDRREKAKEYTHRYKYGVEPEEYENLLHSQEGVCAICLSSKSLRIDHNHETGEVRGLLCHGCNVALGHFMEDAVVLRRAVEYLGR